MRDKNFNTGVRGVLLDAGHYERMGSALWLYSWLILRQTHQTGSIGWVLGGAPVSYREIEEETGFNRRTLEGWFRRLRREGYIETSATPTGVVVRITKARKYSQTTRRIAERLRQVAATPTPNCVTTDPQNAQIQQFPARMVSSSIERIKEKEKSANSTAIYTEKSTIRAFFWKKTLPGWKKTLRKQVQIAAARQFLKLRGVHVWKRFAVVWASEGTLFVQRARIFAAVARGARRSGEARAASGHRAGGAAFMKLLRGIRREVTHGGVVPHGWQMAWYEPRRRTGVYYPRPLNLLLRALREFVYRVQLAVHAPRLECAQVFDMERLHRERERLAEEYARGYMGGWRECFRACLDVVEEEIACAHGVYDAYDVAGWLAAGSEPGKEN